MSLVFFNLGPRTHMSSQIGVPSIFGGSQKLGDLACQNIRSSSIFAAGDVSREGTSATQWHKFHTDDVISVRNPVRRADWSTE